MSRLAWKSVRACAPAALLTLVLCLAGEARAQGIRPPVSEPPLFYNYYVPPNPNAGVGAAMYPSPRTTIPPYVGHTYITYQALAPHEFLYEHKRTYFRYQAGAGFTKARVRWCAPVRLTDVAGAVVGATYNTASTIAGVFPIGH